jgi:ADP-ribosyl-[dinitrogen reductase] hydrolase
MKADRERARGCLLGLAAGDAVGTTVEFRARGSFTPVTDMVGGGPFGLRAGQWTDDTSMALCLASSLVERGGFDAMDQMLRYVRWMDEGYWSSTGTCFDIGTTTSGALRAFQRTNDPFSGSAHRGSAGNGSLMRLAPIPLFYFPDLKQTVHFAGESSRTTHGAAECIDACRLLAALLHQSIGGVEKDALLGRTRVEISERRILEIAAGTFREKRREDIRGSGYVVDCLEAALWCFFHSASFEAAILEAVNLGDDTDTTAAVCGQIAGAYYGESGIPAKWLERLAMRAEIANLAEALTSTQVGDQEF